MIDRQGRRIIFECDTCDEVFDADTEDFSDAWMMAKANEWRSRKIAGEWNHFCGKCRS